MFHFRLPPAGTYARIYGVIVGPSRAKLQPLMSIASSTNSTEELRFPDIFRKVSYNSGAYSEDISLDFGEDRILR